MGFQAGIVRGQSSTHHPGFSSSTLHTVGTGELVRGGQPSRDMRHGGRSSGTGLLPGSFSPQKKLTPSACRRLLPDRIQGAYRQEELALLVLGRGQVAFTYRSSSSAPCFA